MATLLNKTIALQDKFFESNFIETMSSNLIYRSNTQSFATYWCFNKLLELDLQLLKQYDASLAMNDSISFRQNFQYKLLNNYTSPSFRSRAGNLKRLPVLCLLILFCENRTADDDSALDI